MRVLGITLLIIWILGIVGVLHIRASDRGRTWGHCWDDFSGGGVDYEFVGAVLDGVEQAQRARQPHGKVMTACWTVEAPIRDGMLIVESDKTICRVDRGRN
jgi:hypothetical protein